MESNNSVKVVVKEVYLEKGNITLIAGGRSLRLRKFQEDLVRVLGQENNIRCIGLEAPTGSGKTFALLAPLISNILFDTDFQGAVGLYPTKPLVNDQFISIRNTLDWLGRRVYELKGEDGYEVAVKYHMDLKVIDEEAKKSRSISIKVGLVRLTKEVLNKLEEKMKEVKSRITLLDLLRNTLLDADYLITIAVPEYPYLMLSSLYRSVPDAQKLLTLAAEGDFVYKFARKITNASDNEINSIMRRMKRVLNDLLSSKRQERMRLNIYSALFSDGVFFLDEFHTWTIYERPTVLALILLFYLESLRSPRPERYKLILSSATPQREFYELLTKIGLGEVKIIEARLASKKVDVDRVKSRTIVYFIPTSTKFRVGSISWFMIEEELPYLVKEYASRMLSYERIIVFGRRSATVEKCAEVFQSLTNEKPAVITGVKPSANFHGREILEERREYGKLFVFGNYSVELGVDLRKISFGIVYGVYLGEIIQRMGRIGRGDVEKAEVLIPIPSGYLSSINNFIYKVGHEIDYRTFIDLLREIIPEKLSIETYGTSFIMNHKIGKIRIYLPLATYIITLAMLWEYTMEYRKLCQKFVSIVDRLELKEMFNWMRDKVSKAPRVLVPLASFRLATSIPYVRDGIEDRASLSTLIGNYELAYRNGKLEIKGISKKSLGKVLTLNSQYQFNIEDIVISSKFLLSIKDIISKGDNILLNILKNYDIPLYIAPLDQDYKLFNVFGYAIRIELTAGGRVFYMLLL